MDWVYEQIAASGVDDDVWPLVVAALEGDHVLDDYVSSGAPPQRERRAPAAVPDAGGTFLTSIAVEGFRGIGLATTLELHPRPGLTIVAGRNGSGKSSLAEAFELVLTGETYRWRNKTALWSERWRNLHHGHAEIRVGLVEEARGPVTVSTTWPDGATDLKDRTTRTQRTVDGQVQPQQDGLGDLGWARPLEQFRPMLSYDELGGLLEQGPSKLYDALASILGVEQISDALKRIQARLKEFKAPQAALTGRRKALQLEAAGLDDERAAQAAALLKKTSPDSAALRALATGTAPAPAGPVGALRGLVGISFPVTAEQVGFVAGRVRDALAGVADSADAISQRELARLEILESALAAHAAHGDMSCPVCRRGELDADWAATNRDLATDLRRQMRDLATARQTLRIAVGDLQKLRVMRPAILDSAPLPALDEAVRRARDAWDRYADLPAGEGSAADLARAEHLETHVAEVIHHLETVRQAAARELDALNDAWQPLATQIAGWCADWDEAQRSKPLLDRLVAAEKWLKDNDLKLKNERLAPISNGAREAWSRLRQESDVDIGALSLEGTATKRRVQIATTIDGEDAGSIAVLSQGELHALALSLFIPRATMAASPFRFLILDDPVQAMDPAKVDGLVELLAGLARDHQVVVFSHDDRLPAAVRRSSLDATVLEVTRGASSRVTVQTATDPASRYLDDAFGLVLEHEAGHLEELAVRRTLPGLLRFATEAAAKDRFFSRALKKGTALGDVEEMWQSAGTTRKKVALAVFGEPRPDHELEGWASAAYRKFGLRNVGTGMHQGLKAGLDPRDAAKDVQRLVDDIRSGA